MPDCNHRSPSALHHAPRDYPREICGSCVSSEIDALSADSRFTSLDIIMLQREPLDLSDEVTLEADSPVDRGGFGLIRLGRLNGEQVS